MTDRSAVSDARSDETDHDERNLLDVGREEARTTLDNQLRALEDVDTKASKILRLNVALLSILLTSISIASRSSTFDVAAFLNPLSFAGVGSLLASTAFAALTYTSSDVIVGLRPDDLRVVVDDEYDATRIQEGLVESYANWIEFNAGTNARTIPLVTLTIVLVVYAIAFLTLGILHALLESMPKYIVPITVACLLGFTMWTDLPAQAGRWHAEVEPRRTLRLMIDGFAERFSPNRDNERP